MNDTTMNLPSESGGYKITRFNALQHGVLSRYTVLPWEDEGEYQALLDALVAEHRPRGPTEEHLVEELTGILWRKRRLRLAEAAAYRHGLQDATRSYSDTVKTALVHLDVEKQIERVADAIGATPEDTAEEIRDLDEDQGMTDKALKILRVGRRDAYEKALVVLRADTRDWWQEKLGCDPEDLGEEEEPATPDVSGLSRFLEKDVVPWYAQRRKQLENRPLIRTQALGESLDPDKLERLGRYEVHLDRKLERTLSVLIRLKDLREHTPPS